MKIQINDEKVIDVEEEAAFCLLCTVKNCRGNCQAFSSFVKELNTRKHNGIKEQKTAARYELPQGKIDVMHRNSVNVALQLN